jgi:hypothetical protein
MGGGGYDHWLCRFEPMLGVGTGQPLVPVIGAALDVRVGEAGAIIGFTLRWRALNGRMRRVAQQSPALRLIGHAEGHSHADEDASGDGAPPPLVFVLEGEGIPQLRLSPFYRHEGGHAISFASACRLSLTVDLWGYPAQGGMRLRAFASGGSGHYAYEWGVASIADPFSLETYSGASNADGAGGAVTSEITVALGAYLVVVQVRDLTTGAFQHFQQHVFCSPLTEDGEPRMSPQELMV